MSLLLARDRCFQEAQDKAEPNESLAKWKTGATRNTSVYKHVGTSHFHPGLQKAEIYTQTEQ